MQLKSKLISLARIIADEAERNAPFRKAIHELLSPAEPSIPTKRPKAASRHRRAPALIDPIQTAREGRDVRVALKNLNIEELKDVVAEFGMDPSKLVMKWKDAARIVDHIAETSITRAAKGEVFRH